MSPVEEYTSRLRAFESELRRLDSLQNRIGNGRLALALLVAIAAYFSVLRAAFSPVWILIPIAAFVVLVVFDFRVRRLSSRASRGVMYYRAGLARIEDRWSGSGQAGKRFDDPHHVYSADLDLFGTGGLFELLCIARTRMGEEALAGWLLEPASLDDVKARHTAVDELRNDVNFREEIALLGDTLLAGVNPDALLTWSSAADRLQRSWIEWVARGLAIAFAAMVAVWIATGLLSPLLLVLLVEIGFVYLLKRQLKETVEAAEKTFANLDLLANVLMCIEKRNFQAPLLVRLSTALRSNGFDASRAIGKLRAIVQLIESRRNIVMALIDVPFMISVQAAIAAEKWRKGYKDAVASWLDTVGRFEALVSIATYSYEHPNDPFPEFQEGDTAFAADDVAHPLLPSAKAIANTLRIDAQTGVLLISGSNMSGKSTLLRTVGINVVLAMAGAPVRARRLAMTPLSIGASIRVNDSLHEGSSRFYAEITRLKQLYELSEKSPPLIALLDELLQGTNSADRRVGAHGIMRALISRRAIVIASTHDLALASLGEQHELRITNVHFQDHIEEGRMKFDYKLRPGTVTKSNALELMRAIGLDV